MSGLTQMQEKVKLKIRSMGASGEGVASLDGLVVFVPGALPGETVEALITNSKASYAKGRLVQIFESAPERIEPPCPYYEKCGGCQLQHMTYEGQLKAKRQRVVDALERIGGFRGVIVEPCVPSQSPFAYRNKIVLQAFYGDSGIELGFHGLGTHDRVPIESCMIHCDLGERVHKRIQAMSSPKKGTLRNVLIKSAVNRGESLVVLVTTGLEKPWLQDIARKLMEEVSEVKGVVENINLSNTQVVLGSKSQTIAGKGGIQEEVMGKIFVISPHSFFQVNTLQAEAAYTRCLNMAELDKTQTLIDAYSGVGVFALIASDFAKEVIGIECMSQATADAQDNARQNNVTNARFITGFAEDVLKTLPQANVVFLNPPRKGCDPRVIETLIEKPPERIVYMSCDPGTLARDLSRLSLKYELKEVVPLDMFPQTTHVETIVKLTRKH